MSSYERVSTIYGSQVYCSIMLLWPTRQPWVLNWKHTPPCCDVSLDMWQLSAITSTGGVLLQTRGLLLQSSSLTVLQCLDASLSTTPDLNEWLMTRIWKLPDMPRRQLSLWMQVYYRRDSDTSLKFADHCSVSVFSVEQCCLACWPKLKPLWSANWNINTLFFFLKIWLFGG